MALQVWKNLTQSDQLVNNEVWDVQETTNSRDINVTGATAGLDYQLIYWATAADQTTTVGSSASVEYVTNPGTTFSINIAGNKFPPLAAAYKYRLRSRPTGTTDAYTSITNFFIHKYTYGFQVWNASGELTVDPSSTTGKFMETVSYNQTASTQDYTLSNQNVRTTDAVIMISSWSTWTTTVSASIVDVSGTKKLRIVRASTTGSTVGTAVIVRVG